MNLTYTLVDTEARLAELLSALNDASECALDTEADSMHHYKVRLCLIQITCAERNWIVDPLSTLDLRPLWQTRALQKLILHGADYDLRMLHTFCGFSADQIFDTMVAAKFIGEHRMGLNSLVQKYFDATLAKSNQKADWTQRPLPAAMKRYAAMDTYFLHDLRDILAEKLQRLGRLEWHEQSCQQIVEHSLQGHFLEVNPEAWRVSKSNTLDPLGLAFLRELWHWREVEGEILDRPVYKVLNNEAMVGIARRAASNPHNLSAKSFHKLPRNFTGERLQRFLAALHRAAALDSAEWPSAKLKKPKPVVAPDSRWLEKIREHRDQVATKLGIDPTIIANRNQMITLALPGGNWEQKSHNAGFLPWQWELLAPGIRS